MTTPVRWLLPSAIVLGIAVFMLGSNLGWRGWMPFVIAIGIALLIAAPTARWGAGVAFAVSAVIAFLIFMIAFGVAVGAFSFG